MNDSRIKNLRLELTAARSLQDRTSASASNDLLSGYKSSDFIMPFKALPNVRDLWVRTNILDPLLSRFGVVKKLSPKLESTTLSRRTKAANRYLRIMGLRFEKLLVSRDHLSFWILALNYLEHSKVLRVVALRKLESNWHLKFSMAQVIYLLGKLDAKIKGLSTFVEIVQQYAPKTKADGSKTFRPIGSPAYVDRMYTFLLQSFLVMYFAHYIGDSQHGFLPGRGTLTAWKAIANNLKEPFIYEWDLKGAFPSVSLPHMRDRLTELGMPAQIAQLLFDIGVGAMPKLDRDKQELDEPKIDRQIDLANSLPESVVPLVSAAPEIVPELQKAPGFSWTKALDFLKSKAPEFLRPEGIEEELPNWKDYPKAVPEREAKASVKDQLSAAGFTYVGKDPLAGEPMIELADKLLFNHDIDVFNEDQTGIDYQLLLKVDVKIINACGFEPIVNVDDLLVPPADDPVVTPEDAHATLVMHGNIQATQDLPHVDEADLALTPLEEAIRENRNPPPLPVAPELRGNPQGLGLSPVLWDFVFADSLERLHFRIKHPGAKIVAYADDFLAFSKQKLRGYLDSSVALWKSGLEFSLEKSRPLRENGRWLVSSFKFLGVTYYPKGNIISSEGEALSLQDRILLSDTINGDTPPVPVIAGTPRFNEEKHLDTDPFPLSSKAQLAVSQFDLRDQRFWTLIDKVPSFKEQYPHPQALLDAWGEGLWPASLIPLKVVEGTLGINQDLFDNINRAVSDAAPSVLHSVKRVSSTGLPQTDPQARGATTEALPSDSVKSTGNSFDDYLEGLAAKAGKSPLQWLRSRRAGFILSRLHSKGWSVEASEASRSIQPPSKFGIPFYVEGKLRYKPQPWINLVKGYSGSSALGITNSTSFATVDLLNRLRDPKAHAIRKGLLSNSILARSSEKSISLREANRFVDRAMAKAAKAAAASTRFVLVDYHPPMDSGNPIAGSPEAPSDTLKLFL